MKQYYGNYLGMVIDNNDPEFRGRVQVFIPHILPALYKNWNQDGLDISISCVGDNIPQGLTADVVERLKKILPWAEAASPIVGSSSPGGIMGAIAGAISSIGSATAGAISDVGGAVSNYFDQSPTTIPDGSLPPGAACIIPTEGSNVDTKNLLPGFIQRLNGFYQEATSLGYKIVCSSGFRTRAKQEELYRQNGGRGVAKPGTSSHETGFAVDLKTTGNGVSITKISTAQDKSSNRDTPEYRALLLKYGLHAPLHPEVYNTSVPEKWHIEPIEHPGANRQGRADPRVKQQIITKLSGTAPSTELPNSSQLPPAPNPLTSKSPTNTMNAEPISPTTGLTPTSPVAATASPVAAAAPAAAPAITAAPAGQGGIQGTVSGGGTASDGIQKLAADRTARFENELKDKTLLDRIEFVIKKEGGAMGELIFECAVNRAFFSNRTLKTIFFERAYFKDAKKGDPDATKTIPHTSLTLNAVKNVIYNGGNRTNLATDQAYNDKSMFANKFIKAGATGSWFDLNTGQQITDQGRIQKLVTSPGSGMEEYVYRKDGTGPSSSTAGKNARAYAEKYNIQPTTPSTFNANTPLPPDLGTISTSPLTNEPLNTSQEPQTVMSTDPHGPTVVKNTNDSAKGLFAFPGPGAMVWVFFREGNPLFPVYFAASYSAGEWKSAYGGASLNPEGTNTGTVGSQTASSMRLNPNGAGGIEITHVKDVSDPTGAKDKANVMLYSEDGSNMLFSKGYHQIYTRHDRRDKVDGKVYKTIGGEEEKWVESDSSVNVRGNVFVKIGKIDKESLEAMKQLSDFSKQMNDTLMQNQGEPPVASAAEAAKATESASSTESPVSANSSNTTATTETTSTSTSTSTTTSTSQSTTSGGGSTTTFADVDAAGEARAARQENLDRQMRSELNSLPPEERSQKRREWSKNKPERFKA